MDEPEVPDNKPGRSYLAYSASFGGCVLVCACAGYYLGSFLGDAASGALAGSFVGLAFIGYMAWRIIKKRS